MLKNYLKIALRNLWKNKVISAINITGLAIGMTVCLLIAFYVKDELSYDSYHDKADRIYRVVTQMKIQGFDWKTAGAGIDVAPLFRQTFSEIEQAVRFKRLRVAVLKNNNNLFNEKNVFMADKNIFSVFSFKSVTIGSEHSLDRPNSIVLTQTLAQKYFGNNDAVGKTILFNNQPYTVTGVLADLPSNTDLKFQALVSWQPTKEEEADWMDAGYFTYILFRDKESIPAFEKKLRVYDEKEFSSRGKSIGENDLLINHSIQSLTQLHFEQPLADDTSKGSRTYLYIFSVIAICVLLVACFNFINLYVAQTAKRQKEVGVRKVSGASRNQLIQQFIGEALLMSIMSIILALFLVELISPVFNALTAKNISLSNLDWPFTMAVIGVLLLAGLLAGSYPALYVSSLDPVSILKGKINISGTFNLRKLLLVSQFAISIGLIICTIIAYQQVQFMKDENPGFKKSQVMTINVPFDPLVRAKLPLLKNELMANPKITSVSMAGKPVAVDSKASFIRQSGGIKENLMMSFITIDENFVDVLNIPVIKGRDFSAAIPTDKTKGVIVNEAMVRWMGWKEPIGQKVYPGENPSMVHEVIGVTKDFHYTSMHTKIEPLLLYYGPDLSNMLVNVHPKDINYVRSMWAKLFPYNPFDYTFLDKAIMQQYQGEEKMITIFTSFTFLTILIACLGLFGLGSIILIHRTKEIGIRKVLGASVQSIVVMLSKYFLKPILIAALIAFPLAWFSMNKWLENFAYRININWSVFAMAGLLVAIIGFATISFQAIKAAIVNPVKSLRAE